MEATEGGRTRQDIRAAGSREKAGGDSGAPGTRQADDRARDQARDGITAA